MSGSIDIAIVALIVAVPQAALAIWVMFSRKQPRERRQYPPVEIPPQMQSYFPMQRWRRCRTLEMVDFEMGNGIGFLNSDEVVYSGPIHDNTYPLITSPRYSQHEGNLWDEPHVEAAL